MAKRTRLYELELKDRKILYELDINARRSDSELGKKVGLSKEVVNYRIKKLTEKGIISGYYTMVDFSKLGYLNIRVYLRLQSFSPKIVSEITDDLVNNKNTFEVIRAAANWDLVVTMLVKNLDDFFTTLDKFQIKYKKYILEKEISLFYRYIHYPRNYFINKPNITNTGLTTGGSSEISTDKIDLKLLQALVNEGRASLVELSKKIGITPEAVRYRIKRLETREIILTYKAKISLDALGYKFFKVDIDIEDLTIKSSLRQFVKQHQYVVSENIALSGADFEFDVETQSYEDFLVFLGELRTKFEGSLRTIRYYIATKFHKISYLPQTFLVD